MFENIIDLIKKKNIVIPGILFFNVAEVGINYDELYFLAYLMNLDSLKFDMVKMGKELHMKPKDILKLVNDLSEKNLLSLDIIKKDLDVSEYINLNGLYNKLAFMCIGEKEKKEETNVTLFDEIEKEFKRPLTPREFQIINVWKEVGYLDETIRLALKEASYNQVLNIAYIDKILNDWDKKGIRTKEDVERNREQFAKKKEQTIQVDEDYDWLNEE